MTSLSDSVLRSLAAPEKGQKLYSDSLAGFGCRVSYKGTKTFVLQLGRERRKITIGRYPIISLSQARTEAKRLLAEHTLGKTRPQLLSYEAAVKQFLEDKAQNKRPSTVNGYRLKLARLKFSGPVQNITHEDAARRVNLITAPSERSHCIVAGNAFFNWCRKRRLIEHNPLYGLSKPKGKPRDRTLTDDELKAVWIAADQLGDFGCIIRLCITTGQRRGELAQLRAQFLVSSTSVASIVHPPFHTTTSQGIDALCLPESVTKNGREHLVPLSPLSLSVLSLKNCSTSFLFPAKTRSGLDTFFNNWSDPKERLDELSGVKGWTIHDLRRTVATRLAELGIAPHTIEHLLNHITGQGTVVARTYNKYRYLKEKRHALEVWEKHLLQHVVASGSTMSTRAPNGAHDAYGKEASYIQGATDTVQHSIL